jgi:DNA repair protein RAD5
VQSILEAVLLRREKTTKDRDGKPIVQLPPKTTNIEYLDLTPDESKLYDAIFKNVKKDYESFNSSGLITKNITSMLARIMTCASSVFLPRRKLHRLLFLFSLRRAACHPALVSHTKLAREATAEHEQSSSIVQQSAAYSEAVLAGLNDPDIGADSCIICFESMDAQVLIKGCSHTGSVFLHLA